MEPLGLSIPDAGRALGGERKPLSRATIYRMIGRGDIEAFRAGGRTLVSTASLRAYADKAPRLKAAA